MWSFTPGKPFLSRLPHGDDLLESIGGAFGCAGITMGVFWAIGAVTRARIAVYDQAAREYRCLLLDEPAEIVSCTGNISLAQGEPLVHAHIALSYRDGSMKGGHLMEGTGIFACELFGLPLEGGPLRREFDAVTGLRLWGL